MSINLWTSLKRTWQSTPPRRRATVAGTVLAGAALALLVHAAVLNDTFEIDQDATAVSTQPGDDWDFLLANGNANGAFVFDSDAVNSSADDSFTGGGSKDERDISSAGITKTFWQNTQTSSPDKDDLEHAFAASYTAAGTGDLLIYFGADRYSNSGDAAIGFWFFQNEISDNNNSGVFSGVHRAGDILITSDFRQGGGVGVINVFKWVGGNNPLQLLVTKTLAQNATVPDVFCNDPINGYPANTVCATSNRSSKPVPSNWTDGYTFKGSAPPNTFPAGTFFEGGVNITALFPNQTLPCFASFLAMTRTSASTTAQLKDYVLGAFPLCGISVGKACDLENPPTINSDGVTVHTTFTVPIQNIGLSSVYNIKLVDDGLALADNLDCAVTALDGTPITPIALDDTTPALISAGPLAGNTTLEATVECNSTSNPMHNEITATATTSSSGGSVLSANHETSEAEECAATVNPSLSITKDCVLPVTINPTTLQPHVCVDIVITNTSNERLIEGTLVDDKLGTLYGSGGSIASSYSLNPGAVLEVKNRCYDTFAQDDSANTLPGDVIFSDTATTNARGAVSGVLIGDPDDPNKPVPFATAHCPLCPTCPTCD